VGFSRFKSKKHGLGGFRLTGAIHIFDKVIQLPRLGRLRLKERGYLPVEGVHILSATVSEHAGHCLCRSRWKGDPDPQASYQPVVGVDLGILALATISDSTRIENPHALKRDLGKLKRLQRVVSQRKREVPTGRKRSGNWPGRTCVLPMFAGCFASGHQPAGDTCTCCKCR